MNDPVNTISVHQVRSQSSRMLLPNHKDQHQKEEEEEVWIYTPPFTRLPNSFPSPPHNRRPVRRKKMMTEEWVKKMQEENEHLKNQLRLLKENYDLRALLCQQGQYLGRTTGPQVQQQPPLLETSHYSPQSIFKENTVLSNPHATRSNPTMQPKQLHDDPPLFQPRSEGRKGAPGSNVSCSTIGRKQPEEFTDVPGFKKSWLTNSFLPGGDKTQTSFPLGLGYPKTWKSPGSKYTLDHFLAWTEETTPSSSSSALHQGDAQTQAVFSDDLRIPQTGSSPGISDRPAYPSAGNSPESRTDKTQHASGEMPRKKRVSFSDAPSSDRQMKLYSFYLSDFEIAQSKKKNGRVVGEIAFQLDRRILAYVFPGITRLYGFTVSNIPQKIKQVSVKPLDGSLDEKKYRATSQRYVDLSAHLEKMGYSNDFHPVFSEFLINTYGILKQRPDLNSSGSINNSPAELRRVVIDTVPPRFLRDTLVLLNCLCEFSKEDKTLFAW